MYSISDVLLHILWCRSFMRQKISRRWWQKSEFKTCLLLFSIHWCFVFTWQNISTWRCCHKLTYNFTRKHGWTMRKHSFILFTYSATILPSSMLLFEQARGSINFQTLSLGFLGTLFWPCWMFSDGHAPWCCNPQRSKPSHPPPCKSPSGIDDTYGEKFQKRP